MKRNPKSEIRKPKEGRGPKMVRGREASRGAKHRGAEAADVLAGRKPLRGRMVGVRPWEEWESFWVNRAKLGEMVRKGREARGWGLLTFALHMGLSVSEARELEEGSDDVLLGILTRLAVVFGGIRWSMRRQGAGAEL